MAQPPPQATYQVNLSVGEGGIATPSSGTYTMEYAAIFTVKADADKDHDFDRFIINGLEYFENPFSLPVYASLAWTALFKPKEAPPPSPPPEIFPIPEPIPVRVIGKKPIIFDDSSPVKAIRSLAEMISDGINNTILWFQDASKGLNNIVSIIGGLLSGFWSSLSSSLSGLISKGGDAYANVAVGVMTDALKGSPAWMAGLGAYANAAGASIQEYSKEAVDAVINAEPTEDLSIYAAEADKFKWAAIGAILPSKVIGLVSEIGGLGQLKGINDLVGWYDQFFGLTEIASTLQKMPLEKYLVKGYEYFTNTVTPLNLPTYQDLINMRVKEKISQADFEKYMLWMGYANKWSSLIWDAHFSPANWADFLTAWRRGKTVTVPAVEGAYSYTFGQSGQDARDIEVIKKLSELADFDPAYWSFFETRLYNDIPMTWARWMRQTGAINDAQVDDIVRRAGVPPEYRVAVANMIKRFDNRTYQRRYWMALQSGVTVGVVNEEELRSVLDIDPTTVSLADWMLKTADVRKRIAGAKPEAEKEKLLSVSELKQSYYRDLIDEQKLRTELALRGYSIEDVDILLKLINAEKEEQRAGVRRISLSESDLLAAWRYQEISEDSLRAMLMLRGMTEAEINILINTKRKAWGVGLPGQPGLPTGI